MQDCKLQAVHTEEQVRQLCALAKEIWTEHFTPLLEPGQVPYMLDKFQSPAAVSRQLEEGYLYYFLICDGKPVGYSGVKPENDALFLSKIYITKEYRGKKLARFAMEQYVAYCRKNGLRKIWLTVNRHNSNTIAAYRKMGFETVRAQVTEIGGDSVLDDYIMEKPVE